MKYLKLLLYSLLFSYSNLFAYLTYYDTMYITQSQIDSGFGYVSTGVVNIPSSLYYEVAIHGNLPYKVITYGNKYEDYSDISSTVPTGSGFIVYYNSVTTYLLQSCPSGTAVTDSSNKCLILCEPPINKIIVPVVQSSCIGDQTINNVSYTSMEWGCDNQCYASSSNLVTCDELLSAFESSCNSVTNIPNFKCYENGLNPLTVDSSCTPKPNPCDTIITDFSNNCKSPNVISGDCTSANFAITSNTLECLPPLPDTNPCDTFRNNLVVTCKFPNYITGECNSLDGLTINTNTLICNIPTLDGNSTATTTDDIRHQTDAITSSIEQTTSSSNKRLDSLINNSSNLYAISQTTNTKLDSLINNINSNSVNNINKLDKLINEAKSTNSKLDISTQYSAGISDKIQQSNTKLDGIKSSIDSINNNTDLMLNGDTDDRGVSSSWNSVMNEFLTFRDNISNSFDNLSGQFANVQTSLDVGFINNLPTTVVTGCPFNNTLTGLGLSIPVTIDVCAVIAPFYSSLYFIFYIIFFAGMLTTIFKILTSTRSN